jgi:hypothetical protein
MINGGDGRGVVRGLTGAKVVERREAVGHGGIAGGWGELD